LDSGATATFITEQLARDREYKSDAIVGGPNVTWGDASVSTPIKHTTWMNDSMKALEDCLISVHDYTKQGNAVLFNSGGERIFNDWSDDEIAVTLVNGQFCVDLNDVEHIPMSGIITSKSVPLEAHVSKLGLGERIKELHERMEHVNPRIILGEIAVLLESRYYDITDKNVISAYVFWRVAILKEERASKFKE